MGNITTFVNRMRYWCTQANLGYDQTNRWDIRPGGECDCSSLVIYALREAGFDTGAASYTGNMSSNLTARGWVRLPNNGSPKIGDILLNDVQHVAVYVGNGMLCQASISENGTISGAAGDQTGYETNMKAYYNKPWNCYLRYVGATTSGSDKLAVDGSCGPATIRKWQQVMGTTADGIISGQNVPDEKTYWRPNLVDECVEYGDTGSDLIRAVQKQLKSEGHYSGSIDGLLGPGTIKGIQAHYGLTQDASFGPATVKALQTALNNNKF